MEPHKINVIIASLVLWHLNISPSQWIGSALVQIMTCRLFGAKPLSKLTLIFVNLTVVKETLIKIQNASFTKMLMKISYAKWRPFSPGGDELLHYGSRLLALYYLIPLMDSTITRSLVIDCVLNWLATSFPVLFIDHIMEALGIVYSLLEIQAHRIMLSQNKTKMKTFSNYSRLVQKCGYSLFIMTARGFSLKVTYQSPIDRQLARPRHLWPNW